MNDLSGGRPDRISRKLTVLSFFSPVIAMAFASAKLFRHVGARRGLIALSVFFNVFFVVAMIAGSYDVETGARHLRTETGDLVGPRCEQVPPGPLVFCESPPQDELTRIVPNAIYVAFGGRIRARFEFADESLRALREVTLSDSQGRPWIDANLEDGTLVFSRYSEESQIDPDASLIDRDGDGVPDKMVDWVRGESFERSEDIIWHSLKDEK